MFTWTMVEIIVASWVCSFSVLCLELPESACAVSLRTVGVISRCPRNKYEYDVASTRKNCSQYNATGCLELHYHCVLNENATGLVEVCAASRFIFSGRCASFSNDVQSIGDSYIRNCTYSNPACPQHYNSTDSYMYAVCYNVVEGHVENNE
ncbi:uncharacterized protein LOC125654537 isoform X2 [Ostrea edulis]|uniref:uncharacterized protein LOC125654537 isoform X2 n=1 Tax=Ostrea edulis TaxID=37623 RepID=UPI0024AECE85|nr:uncharacterized protein LOC125654537 isoform X2 [Ostrea edulis]